MKSYQEWLRRNKNESVKTHNASWGVELTGTTSEIIEALRRYPADGYCVASVEFENRENSQRLGSKINGL